MNVLWGWHSARVSNLHVVPYFLYISTQEGLQQCLASHLQTAFVASLPVNALQQLQRMGHLLPEATCNSQQRAPSQQPVAPAEGSES